MQNTDLTENTDTFSFKAVKVLDNSIVFNFHNSGLCGSETKVMEGFFDILYFIKGFVNLKPHWRGYGKSHIFFVPEKGFKTRTKHRFIIRTSGVWRLQSFYDKEKKAEFFATDENPYDYWPTGKIYKLITKI